MDVIIFGGQSNMQGQTESMPSANEPIAGAREYKYWTNEFVPLRHPVGENIEGQIARACDTGGGSIVPAFCRAYVEKTGREVIAVHAAMGNTSVGEWLYGTQHYHVARKKIRAALKKAGETGTVDHVFYVWLQGESDAIISTTEDEYADRLKTYKNQLKQDIGFEKFALIRVGYFVSEVSWLKDERTHEERKRCDEAIMRAQDRLAQTDEDFIMLTGELATMSLNKRFINPQADGHLNNLGADTIGAIAGERLAAFVMSL